GVCWQPSTRVGRQRQPLEDGVRQVHAEDVAPVEEDLAAAAGLDGGIVVGVSPVREGAGPLGRTRLLHPLLGSVGRLVRDRRGLGDGVPAGGLDCGGGAERVRSGRFVVLIAQLVPVGHAAAPRLVRARARVARATARYSLGFEGRPVLIAYCSWAATTAS